LFGRGSSCRRRFDMDDHVDNLRVARHEPVLDHMRRGVRLLQRGAAVEPEMEVEEDVIGRASSTNSMTTDRLRYGPYDVPHVVFGNDHLVREDAGRHLRDLPAGMSDEPGNEKRRQR